MNKLWDNVTEEDVKKAIELFDRKQEKYPKARSTFLIFNDKKYPAKHIRGLAYFVANQNEILKNDYSGGQETAKFFTKIGFTVQYKNEILQPTAKTQEHETIKKVTDVKTASNKLYVNNQKIPLQRLFQKIANFFMKLGFIVQYKKETLQPIVKTQESKTINIVTEVKTIPNKLNVVNQKNALQRLFQMQIGHIETEKKFDWLKTPDHNDLPIEYKSIVSALSKYRNQNGFQKSNYQLLCDIVLEDHKLIIEYDENQHFTKARKITLENYPQIIQLNFSKETWIAACEKINAKDNSPIDRDEKRAYYDAVRDIEANKNGYTLIRIKHGDFDWEGEGAEKNLKDLLLIQKTKSAKHKIARLIVTGKHYDEKGHHKFEELQKLLEKFIVTVYDKQQFEFIITPGGFMTFQFPENLRHNIEIEKAEKDQVPLFQTEATKVINGFFSAISTNSFKKLQDIADYFTIGIDGYNPTNNQVIELVAVYDLKKEKVIKWTGKFYPTEKQKKDLIKINDLNTHFIELNNQKILILGCHDLNVYSPRGQAASNPEGWKKQIAVRFKKLCEKFDPTMILQHPHSTDTPNIWNLAWRTVEKELPNVRHFASGIKYYHINGVRGDIDKVLEKTKKGDVIDFYFN